MKPPFTLLTWAAIAAIILGAGYASGGAWKVAKEQGAVPPGDAAPNEPLTLPWKPLEELHRPDLGGAPSDEFEPSRIPAPPWNRKSLAEARRNGLPTFEITDKTPYDVQLVLFASVEGGGLGRFTAIVDPSGRFEVELPQGEYYVMPGAGPFEDMFYVQDYPLITVENDRPVIEWMEPRKRPAPPDCDDPETNPMFCEGLQ